MDYAFDTEVQPANATVSVAVPVGAGAGATDVKSAPGVTGAIDPRYDPRIAHRTRKDFRDHDKAKQQALEKIAKALGGVAVAFEADYPHMFHDENLSKDYRYKLGYHLYAHGPASRVTSCVHVT